MSWSVYTVAKLDQVEERVNTLQPPGDAWEPRDEQVEVAKAVAKSIIDSGAVGKGEAFAISLSGHANEGHVPQSGYANDLISVSVSQTSESAMDAFDAQAAQAQRNLE